MPNCLAYPIAVFGCLKAGLVMVNTNPLYTPAEMTHQFTDSGAVGLVAIDVFANKVAEVLPKTAIRQVVLVSVADLLPPLKRLVVRTVQKYVKKMIPPVAVRTRHVSAGARRGRGARRRPAPTSPSLRVGADARQHRGAAVHRRHDRRVEGRGADARQSAGERRRQSRDVEAVSRPTARR